MTSFNTMLTTLDDMLLHQSTVIDNLHTPKETFMVPAPLTAIVPKLHRKNNLNQELVQRLQIYPSKVLRSRKLAEASLLDTGYTQVQVIEM